MKTINLIALSLIGFAVLPAQAKTQPEIDINAAIEVQLQANIKQLESVDLGKSTKSMLANVRFELPVKKTTSNRLNSLKDASGLAD